MNSYSLKAVTWGTLAAALVSALLLAAADARRPDSDPALHPSSGRPSAAYPADGTAQTRARTNAGTRSQSGASPSGRH